MSRRFVNLVLLATGVAAVAFAGAAHAQTPLEMASTALTSTGGKGPFSLSLQVLILMTLLAVLPAVMLVAYSVATTRARTPLAV